MFVRTASDNGNVRDACDDDYAGDSKADGANDTVAVVGDDE